MKYIFISIFAFLTMNAVAQTELEHGLTTGWGNGSLSGLEHNIDDNLYDGFKIVSTYADYRYNVALGYRFRLKQQNSKLFYDADITLGIKKYLCGIELFPINYDSEKPLPYPSDTPYGYYYAYNASLALSCNYLLFRNLYAGIGIAPYYRYRTEGTMPQLSKKLDIPVFARIGYDFRFIDVSFAYKLGLTNMVQDKNFAGRINDWQLQLFIPF